MAQTEREAGSKLIYRNVAFNSYNLLNAREDVITGKPELVEAVVNAYQRARAWAKRHPGELTALLARDSKVTPEVAAIQLKRSTFELDPVPGAPQRKVLDGILPILVQDGDVKSEEAARTALESLFEPGAARRVAAP
jgi:sulfonate transport system substrate-binding protein